MTILGKACSRRSYVFHYTHVNWLCTLIVVGPKLGQMEDAWTKNNSLLSTHMKYIKRRRKIINALHSIVRPLTCAIRLESGLKELLHNPTKICKDPPASKLILLCIYLTLPIMQKFWIHSDISKNWTVLAEFIWYVVCGCKRLLSKGLVPLRKFGCP